MIKVGDQVRHRNWDEEISKKVLALFDGYMWLQGEGEAPITYSNDFPGESFWSVVEPFFEEGKEYRYGSTGKVYRAERVLDRGGILGFLVSIDGHHGLIVYPGDFERFEAI